ncbi:MAG: hypothetical protein RR141_01270 [Rikenellaceae bacterium]
MKNMNEQTKKCTETAVDQVTKSTLSQNDGTKRADTFQENIVQHDSTLSEKFIAALRKQINELEPELSIENDSDLFDAVLKKINNDHSSCIRLSEQNKAIANTIKANPRLLFFLEELMRGTNVRVALAKSDLINVAPDSDDDDYEDYNMAVAQTRERHDEIKKQAQRRLSKCQKCGEIAQQFYEETELSDEQIDDFINFLERAIETIFEADIDRQFIETMWKAYNFDKEIQNAKQQGIVEGKNEVITIRRASQTDGLPSFSSSGVKSEAPVKQGYIERLMNERYG